MAVTVSTGIPGLDEIGPGTHLCALYFSSGERDRLLFLFLREKIREGDKCLSHPSYTAAGRRKRGEAA